MAKKKKKKQYKSTYYLSGVLVIESIILCAILKMVHNKKNNHINTIRNIELSSEYQTDEIYYKLKNALYSNPYLSDKEKEYIGSYIWVFAMNKDYMDLTYFENCLNTLKINYVKKVKLEKNNIIDGEYNNDNNTINFYNVNSISEVRDFTFTHEMFHIMQKVYFREFNSFLVESINTIYNEEYTNREEHSMYKNYYNFTKMLMEIIGTEPIKEFQGYTMSAPIIDALVSIYNDEKYANELLLNLDLYKDLFDNNNGNEKKLKELKRLKERIIEQLGFYYEKEYNRKMSKDYLMLYYYDFDKFLEEFSRNQNINIKGINNNFKYFNQDSYNSLVVYYEQEVVSVFINPGESKTEKRMMKDYVCIIDDESRFIEDNLELKKK